MKINYGVTAKMGAYIKSAKAHGEPVMLITAKDPADEQPYVYLVNSYIAFKTPLAFYAESLQPYTCTDAPAEGETKTLTGTPRDGRTMPATIERMFSSADKQVYESGFTCRSVDGKKGLHIFSIDDGSPLLLDGRLLALFDMGGGATLKGSKSLAPLTITGSFGWQAIVLPVRLDDGRKQTFEAISQATADKYNGEDAQQNRA